MAVPSARAEQSDWEIESAAVVDRPAHRVSPEGAREHMAGRTVTGDLTDRATALREADVPRHRSAVPAPSSPSTVGSPRTAA